jgi:LysR family transcriptional regulator, nitrogen assimilation regulatory protein
VTLHPSEGYSGEILDALLSERLDVAIVDPPSHPHVALTATPLWLSALRVVGPSSAAHSSLFKESWIGIEAAATLPFIMPSRASSLRRVVDRAFSRHRTHFQPVIEAEGPLMILEMVRLGLGFTIFPQAGFFHLEGEYPVLGGVHCTSVALADGGG